MLRIEAVIDGAVLGFRVLRASGVILVIGLRACDCEFLGFW